MSKRKVMAFVGAAAVLIALLGGAFFALQRPFASSESTITAGGIAQSPKATSTPSSPLPEQTSNPETTSPATPTERAGASSGSVELEPSRAVSVGSPNTGLDEPSGLAAAPDGGFWTVSDRTPALFRISATGEVLETVTLRTGGEGLEGVSLGPIVDGVATIFTVEEEGNTVTLTDVATGAPVIRAALTEMDGYAEVRDIIESGGSNKGLEGVTWDANQNRLYVLKEGQPGVLLELAPDLTTILSFQELTPELGFVDDTVSGDKLDFSGLTFDDSRNALWIVSDKGQRAFVYDLGLQRVTNSLPLLKPDSSTAIDKAEGVAISDDGRTVTVMSESTTLMITNEVVPAS